MPSVRKASRKASEPKASDKMAPSSSQVKKIAGKKSQVNFSDTLFYRPKKVSTVGIRVPRQRDLTHFVRWPRYIRIQRQRNILMKRMKVPPAINQFTQTLPKSAAVTLFRVLDHHGHETPQAKRARLLKAAMDKTGQLSNTKRPYTVKCGIRLVTKLIERKQAKLVVIANDVSPIEIVLWLPTLCKKKGIPYIITKDKARLGRVVKKKKAAVLAFVEVRPQDKADFSNLVQIAKEKYNDMYEKIMHTPGGMKLSKKTMQRKAKQQRLKAIAAKSAKKVTS
ncbi:60S ribosomal protein L7a-like [Schistocerca gregaria]|uniref:60S ribosomal protein L7a-like n=1 Tax=Schistocerca gregaria TaxID=7010 RepID=UPI00211E9029|nr:60S ribosomal protein L7a-like [Schistocerca gregaria]